MMTLSATPHTQPTAPTARPPLANQLQVSGCLQPAHQSIWFGVAAGFNTTSDFISTCTGLQGFNRYSYCTNNPLKYTDPSGYRRKPDGWDLDQSVALNGGISPGGRMGPGSGKHWSDGFRSGWGNFMLGNQESFDGMYGAGTYNNFVNYVYPKEKKQTSHDDRLLMHFLGFKWNPVGGVEVERGGADGDLRIYCSGSWQKKDGGQGRNFIEGQGNGWLDDIMSWGIAPASNIATTIAGLKFTSSNFFRKGYWRGANGKYYALPLTQKGTQGWVFYQGSANMAKNSVRWLGQIGNGLGALCALYTGRQFLINPNLSNGIDFGVSILSVAFWEVGAVYYGGKSFYELTRTNTNYLMNNGIDPGMQFIINKE